MTKVILLFDNRLNSFRRCAYWLCSFIVLICQAGWIGWVTLLLRSSGNVFQHLITLLQMYCVNKHLFHVCALCLQSSALVFGWYTSQLIHLKCKKESKLYKKCYLPRISYLYQILPCLNNDALYPLKLQSQLEVSYTPPAVHLVSNDHSGGHNEASRSHSSSSSGTEGSDDLGEVLNSIENRLGLAAIENGQHQDGLNLLRWLSAVKIKKKHQTCILIMYWTIYINYMVVFVYQLLEFHKLLWHLGVRPMLLLPDVKWIHINKRKNKNTSRHKS